MTGSPVVAADALQLQRVFQNLITNALKYGPRDGGKIRIERSGHHRGPAQDPQPLQHIGFNILYTALFLLAQRFYDPQGGRILIDGQDIKGVTQKSLRAAIGIVPQDSVLFNESIGYNIAYGRPDATDEQLAHEARSGTHFIETLRGMMAIKLNLREPEAVFWVFVFPVLLTLALAQLQGGFELAVLLEDRLGFDHAPKHRGALALQFGILARGVPIIAGAAGQALARGRYMGQHGRGHQHHDRAARDLDVADMVGTDHVGIGLDYTNVYWGGRAEIKPSEVAPSAYRKTFRHPVGSIPSVFGPITGFLIVSGLGPDSSQASRDKGCASRRRRPPRCPRTRARA